MAAKDLPLGVDPKRVDERAPTDWFAVLWVCVFVVYTAAAAALFIAGAVWLTMQAVA